MSNSPSVEEAAFVGFAVLDELIQTLQAKHLITNDEAIQVLSTTADRLGQFERPEYQASSNFIRTVMVPAYRSRR
jgi:hypothetical protein